MVDLFGEDAAQLKQQLGLEHAISVDLAFHLKEETVELNDYLWNSSGDSVVSQAWDWAMLPCLTTAFSLA